MICFIQMYLRTETCGAHGGMQITMATLVLLESHAAKLESHAAKLVAFYAHSTGQISVIEH